MFLNQTDVINLSINEICKNTFPTNSHFVSLKLIKNSEKDSGMRFLSPILEII